mmetsp:Transcript_81634/g.231475  ORF Transcript_81634/g.231475 Transcript_81634/m.231475 type:complete len:103 (-) Transcript_81634:52-360(-)
MAEPFLPQSPADDLDGPFGDGSLNNGKEGTVAKEVAVLVEGMSPREMVSTTLFWVIALCFGCGVGGAVMVENMVKDIVKSRGVCDYADVGNLCAVSTTNVTK